MLGEQVKESTQEKKLTLLSKSPTNSSLRSVKNTSNNVKYLSEDDEYQYSVLSKTTSKEKIKKRRLRVNRQGQKKDEDYLSKDFTPFSTTYKQNNEKLKDSILPVVPEHELPTKEQSRNNLQISPPTTSTPNSNGLKKQAQLISLLDQIPLNDPIWELVIPDILLKDPNVNVERLVEENQNYFYNLLGLLFQERSMRELPYTKVTLPIKFQKQSQPLQIPQEEPITSKAYETKFPNGKNLNFHSTYQSGYPILPSSQTENFKPEFTKYYQQLQTLTSYNHNYPDWHFSGNERIENGYLKSTGSLPFIGQTSYQEAFKKINELPNQPFPQKKIGPFASGTDLLFKESQNKLEFKSHKVNEVQKRATFFSMPILPGGSFAGQYKSTFSKFAIRIIIICRAFNKSQILTPEANQQNKVWKRKMIQKINELRSQPVDVQS